MFSVTLLESSLLGYPSVSPMPPLLSPYCSSVSRWASSTPPYILGSHVVPQDSSLGRILKGYNLDLSSHSYLAQKEPACVCPGILAPAACGKSHNPPMCCGPFLCPAASGHELAPHGLRFWDLCYLLVSFSLSYTHSGAHTYTTSRGHKSSSGQSRCRQTILFDLE